MKNVFELLKNAAEKSPNRVVFEDSSPITYKEALEKVKGVACYLKRRNIKSERILVNVGRDYRTLLLFLGIALSGNCYVPSDDSYPEERKKDIISIGEIVHGFDAENLANLSSFEALNETPSEEEVKEMEASFDAEAPLCLLFTSGSTGRPKGVLKCHRNMLAFVSNFLKTVPLPEGARLANQTPFSFDASAKDIYLTLAVGGTLCIPDRSEFALPKVLVDYLNDKKIDTIFWVPSALTGIAKTRTLNFVKPECLKYVFFIGETFPPKYLNMWVEAMPKTRFFNLYGSTEIAGACLYHEVKGPQPIDAQIPLGQPIFGNDVYLGNGEICVISDQVALGYYGDQERTAKTFLICDDVVNLHTGDYGHLDANRDFVFNARKDFQIKHMGYRIELQDIEVALSSLDYINDICCLYDADKSKIVLVVTLNRELVDAQSSILADARKKLPAYMVPGAVRVLKEMPMNANGKIDRVGLSKTL